MTVILLIIIVACILLGSGDGGHYDGDLYGDDY